MSGILDSKSRIIDTVITDEGRRQLAAGRMNVRFISFSDAAVFYRADAVSGSQDASRRLYLEACSLPQDQVTFRSDGSGDLLPFANSDGVQVTGGRIITYSFTAASGSTISGSSQRISILTGEELATSASVLLESSLDNFRKLRTISSVDPLFDDGFAVGPDDVTFVVTDDRPIPDASLRAVDVTALHSIFNDPRFSSMPNFRYLPPTNRVPGGVDRSDASQLAPYLLGAYRPWATSAHGPLTYEQLNDELRVYEQLGCMRTVNFEPTSSDNRLSGQAFERSFDRLKKLDVVDFGVHRTGSPTSPLAHVFFVGKVVVDDNGVDTFLHLFTMVFE